MNKKKLFGLLTSAAMLLNGAPLSILAEEMPEASGVLGGVTNDDGSIAINNKNFPDENLLKAIQDQSTATDAAKVESLNVPDSVEDLSGLQYLTGLTTLNISGNTNLSTLDLSKNTALQNLTVSNNPGLVAVTLPTTEELETVTITGNKSLTEFDLTPASLVQNAYLQDNALAKLTVTNNLHLDTLDVHGNVLYALDTTGCRHLVNICAAGNRIYEINITSRAIQSLDLGGNKLTSLDVSEMVNLQKLNVADNMLESIELPDEGNLVYFNCDQNHLASLDLSNIIDESAEIRESNGSGPVVITGTQSLFAGTEDTAINLKNYDANFNPAKTDVYKADGTLSGTQIGKNGVADLADTGSTDIPDNSGNGGGTVTPPPAQDKYVLTDENTSVVYKTVGNSEEEEPKDPAEDNGGAKVQLQNALIPAGDEMREAELANGTADTPTTAGTTDRPKASVNLADCNITLVITTPDSGDDPDYQLQIVPKSGADETNSYYLVMPTAGNIDMGDGGKLTLENAATGGTAISNLAAIGVDTTAKVYLKSNKDTAGTAPDFNFYNGTASTGVEVTVQDNRTELTASEVIYSVDDTNQIKYLSLELDANGTPVTITDAIPSAPTLSMGAAPGTGKNFAVVAPAADMTEISELQVTSDGLTAYWGNLSTAATATDPILLKYKPQTTAWQNVKATKEVELSDTNTRVLYTTDAEGNATAKAIQYSATPDVESSWKTIYEIPAAPTPSAVTISSIDTTNNVAKSVVPTADWAKDGVGYAFPEGGLATVPAVNETSTQTTLNADNTRVLYTMTGDNNDTPKALYLQVNTGSDGEDNWVTVYDFSNGGLQADGIRGEKATSVTLASGNDSVTLDPATYIFPKEGLTNIKAFQVTELSEENLQVVYEMGEDGTPVFVKVQIKDGDVITSTEDETKKVFSFDHFDDKTDPATVTVTVSDATALPNEFILPEDTTVFYNVDAITESPAESISLENATATITVTKDTDGNPVYTLTVTPKAEEGQEAPEPVKYTGPAILANFTLADGETPITDLTALADLDGKSVTLTATDANETFTPGTSTDATVTVTSGEQPVVGDYQIVSMTIDGKEITDSTVLANFALSNVQDDKGELTYAEGVEQSFKDQYQIQGTDGATTITVTATEETPAEEPNAALMTETTATEGPQSVLSKDNAPVALAYAYDTDANVSGDKMTVKVYKENLMNRLYNPNSGEHFYTKDNHEKDVLVSLGWQYEGTGWVAPTGPVAQAPVYRLYNPNAGDHHYTKDANEKDTLVRVGWSFEGVGWYSAADPVYYQETGTMTGTNGNRTIDVFREYNPNAKAAGAHNYTISENENAVLVSLGWIDEGIAWNALK